MFSLLSTFLALSLNFQNALLIAVAPILTKELPLQLKKEGKNSLSYYVPLIHMMVHIPLQVWVIFHGCGINPESVF